MQQGIGIDGDHKVRRYVAETRVEGVIFAGFPFGKGHQVEGGLSRRIPGHCHRSVSGAVVDEDDGTSPGVILIRQRVDVSPIARSSFRAAMSTVTPVVGDTTLNGGCLSKTSEANSRATTNPGMKASSVTMTMAAASEMCAASPEIQGMESQIEKPSQAAAKATARPNFHRTDT